ncbi:MAG: LCP family protein [Oscillospiraceae bacterium]|nr:LCP family protein [Oscillospiraceae bacterium]
MNNKNTSGKGKRVALIALTVILALILVVLIVATAYMERMLNLINKNPDDSTMSQEEYEQYLKDQLATEETGFTGETIDPEDVELNLNDKPVEEQDHIVNIMLIGQDRRPGEGRTRSDVMILCTLNKTTKELTMTSFMRDLYVAIPGYKDNKMNATYTFGGMKLLDKCLENNFGVKVDGNIEVDFDGFADIVDLLGGVDIYLSNAEANHLIYNGFSAVQGMNHLSGEAALMYTRNRSVGNSDFTRTERQRKVLNALFEKCRGMNLGQLQNLMEKALPMITTDMSNRELLDLLVDVVPLLADMQVNTNRIPADGTFSDAYISGVGSVLVPDLEANRAVLDKIMGKTEE